MHSSSLARGGMDWWWEEEGGSEWGDNTGGELGELLMMTQAVLLSSHSVFGEGGGMSQSENARTWKEGRMDRRRSGVVKHRRAKIRQIKWEMPVMTQKQTESDAASSPPARGAGGSRDTQVECVFGFWRTAATVLTGFQSVKTTKLVPVFCTGASRVCPWSYKTDRPAASSLAS